MKTGTEAGTDTETTSINLKHLDELNLNDTEHYRLLEKYTAKIKFIHKAKGLVFMGNDIESIYFAEKNSTGVYTSMILDISGNILRYGGKNDLTYCVTMPEDSIKMKSVFGFNNYEKARLARLDREMKERRAKMKEQEQAQEQEQEQAQAQEQA